MKGAYRLFWIFTWLLVMITGSMGITLAETAPEVEWEKTFGGECDDSGYSVQQTYDGGYVIAGKGCGDPKGCFVYLIKTDSSGNLLWERTFTRNSGWMAWFDEGHSVQQTTDGGYIVAGRKSSMETGDDVYLIKTDSSGNLLWERTFGGEEDDEGHSVQQTTDGGYIVAGSIKYDVYLIKTDSSGNLLWERTFGAGAANSVQQTTDGGYIIAGYSSSGVIYLIKTDSEGNKEWSSTFGTFFDIAYSVQQTTDGGYIIAGGSLVGSGGIYLIKTDSEGNKEYRGQVFA